MIILLRMLNNLKPIYMVVAQKPFNVSNFDEKSGPQLGSSLPTWYQISTSDLMIPPEVQQKFAKQMNATTISINASHASYVSHPEEIAKLILDAAKGNNLNSKIK